MSHIRSSHGNCSICRKYCIVLYFIRLLYKYITYKYCLHGVSIKFSLCIHRHIHYNTRIQHLYRPTRVSFHATEVRLGVLETWVLVSRCLDTRFYKSRSRSWSWNLRVLVLVLVLEPSSLGLDLGLGTSESWSWSWSWNPLVWVSVLVLGLATMKTRFLSLMKRVIVRLPPLLLWNGYLATVVCWCGQTGLELVTTCCHSWSTCDATISCKFSCCCTVVISL